MISEFDKVLIKEKNLHGVVVDIRKVKDRAIFTVECEANSPGGYGPDDCLLDCDISELKKIK